jgi:hypothetical protein
MSKVSLVVPSSIGVNYLVALDTSYLDEIAPQIMRAYKGEKTPQKEPTYTYMRDEERGARYGTPARQEDVEETTRNVIEEAEREFERAISNTSADPQGGKGDNDEGKGGKVGKEGGKPKHHHHHVKGSTSKKGSLF